MRTAHPQRIVQIARQTSDGDGNRSGIIAMLHDRPDAVLIAADWIEDQGEQPVESIEIGKRYLIKTVTHYYAGVVRSKTLTDVVMDDVEIVFWTGSWPACGKTGKWERSQKLPNGVILSLMAAVSAIPVEKSK